MKKQTISARQFDLARFVKTIVEFWGDHDVAFPLVANGCADFGVGCLDDDADDPGVESMKRN